MQKVEDRDNGRLRQFLFLINLLYAVFQNTKLISATFFRQKFDSFCTIAKKNTHKSSKLYPEKRLDQDILFIVLHILQLSSLIGNSQIKVLQICIFPRLQLQGDQINMTEFFW